MGMIRLILLLVVAAFTAVSCAPQTLTLDYPSSWLGSDREKQPRWCIAYPQAYASAVSQLKIERARQGYEVVSLEGTKPEQIAEMVKKLKLGSREKDCLLLVGTGQDLSAPAGVHGRTAGVPCDNRYSLAEMAGTPLFPVGRLPAKDPSEASRMIAKILAFEKSAASRPQTALLLVGNPVQKRFFVADQFISALSRRLMKRANPSWEFHGAADVGGHPLEVAEIDFSGHFRKQLTQKYTIGTYFGHSNDWAFSASGGKLSFASADWQTIPESEDKGLFLSCGCFTLQNENAGGYQALRSPGGPVAYIGATGESYSVIGYLAAQGLMGSMGDHPPETVGKWWLNVQESIASRPLNPVIFQLFDRVDGSAKELFSRGVPLREQRLEHLEMWMLLGDPATRMF